MNKVLILIIFSLLISCNIDKKENKEGQISINGETDVLSVYNDVLNDLVENHLYNQYLGREWELIFVDLVKNRIDSTLYFKQLNDLKNTIIVNDTLKGTLYVNDVFNGYDRDIKFLNLPKEFQVDEVEKQISKKNHLELEYLKSNFVKLKSLSKKKEDISKLFEVGVLSLSKIVFNEDNTTGILYFEFICGEKCGEGSLITIKKINNKWDVKKEYTLWEI